jgi:hypothetical protein
VTGDFDNDTRARPGDDLVDDSHAPPSPFDSPAVAVVPPRPKILTAATPTTYGTATTSLIPVS